MESRSILEFSKRPIRMRQPRLVAATLLMMGYCLTMAKETFLPPVLAAWSVFHATKVAWSVLEQQRLPCVIGP